MSNTTTMSARNKKFWAMTKQRQAVAIAKDVIKQLSSKFFRAKTGDYFEINYLESQVNKAPTKLDETFNLLKDNGAICNVCGIGSCFVSLVSLGDNIVRRKCLNSTINTCDSISDVLMRPILRKVFPPAQLTLIESAFEKSYYDDAADTNTDQYLQARAVRFGLRYRSDKGRLTAIMKNIIANKGTFKP